MFRDFQEYFDYLGVEERIDTYLLPQHKQTLLPKFRNGETFEIKRRLDASGELELWEMAAQEEFPLARNTVAWLLDMLDERRLKASPLPDSRSAIEFFAPCFNIFCTPKMRRRFERDGCSAEITHVLISLKSYETIAFECEKPSALASYVEKFQLSDFDNKNYGAKLREIAVPS